MPHNAKTNIASRLNSLEAYLTSFDKGPDEALASLAQSNDPEAIRRKLSILIDANRDAEAANLIRDLEPSAEWAEKAITALVRNGEREKARQVIASQAIQSDLIKRNRCLLVYAETGYIAAFSGRGNDANVLPRSVTEGERSGILDALSVLTPLFQVIEGNGRILTSIEEHSVTIALHARFFLEERAEMEKLAGWLLPRTPVSLPLAHFVASGALQPIPSLPDRLREEHPDSNEAKLLALYIEGKFLGKASEAFEAALDFNIDELTEPLRRRLFELLHELAQDLGPSAMSRLEPLVPKLMGQENETAFKYFQAERYLTDDKNSLADEILQEFRDENDPRWLQLYAYLKVKEGNNDEALGKLIEASKRIPKPDLFRQIARVAYSLDRDEILIDALQEVVSLDPHDLISKRNLAQSLSRHGRYQEAASLFRKLREAVPDEMSHAVNEAASLALAGLLPESLKVYEEVASLPDAPLPAVLGRTEVLRSLDRAKEAFVSLSTHRQRFWGDPRFLTSFMSISYGAGEDREASLALQRLLQLQSEGKAPSDLLKAVTIEDFKQHFKDQLKTNEEISEQLLLGRIPWLLADSARNRIPLLGWALRTQHHEWIGEERRLQAEVNLYSTNGFQVVSGESDSKNLERIECPEKGSTVAIDMSSLLTLSALGLLDEVTSYFESIILPSLYRERIVRERTRLLPHQLSQITAIQNVKAALDSGKITVVDSTEASIVRVDEHVPDSEQDDETYGLNEVVRPLYELGWISNEQYSRAGEVSKRAKSDEFSRRPLRLYQELRIALSTVTTLDNLGLLESVLRLFKVKLDSSDRDEINQSIQNIRFGEDLRSNHESLWKRIVNDPKFTFSEHKLPSKFSEHAIDDDGELVFALASSMIAEQNSIPLLADDRVLQVLSFSGRPEHGPVAFGTDRLIEKLGDVEALSPDRVTNSILQLMRWRYRFIIPSPQVLKTILDRFIDHPPGQTLREVASYAHDCMHDSGLFGGFEPTTPPTSMAARLHQSWCSTIIQFVMLVWADDKWSDDKATEVTFWAVRQMLPAAPSSIAPNVQAVLLRLIPQFVLSNALIKSTSLSSPQRANKGLLSIARAFGMKDKTFQKLVSDVIHEA